MVKTLIGTKEVRGIMTKSNLPVGGYSVNPYVGCTHACKYCYASFMKRFTGHKEEWGTFLDVKHWPAIENPKKYAGQRVVIGSVTDGYNPEEATFRRTRKLLEELKDSDAEILICTKSDLVLRDLDLLRQMKKVTVSWSVNTLDETFRADMDKAVYFIRMTDFFFYECLMHQCFESYYQFLHSERFLQIVVCPQLESFHYIIDGRACREEQYRCQFVCLPDAANHLETIHAGHHYICHYDIRFLCKEGT